MRHLLIGTAGHVDHGKTSLIKALTGIDADRLIEEKKRGITIDLGFAHMPLEGSGSASIIDVPGHEKFVKNMLAGAGGIDLVLLVIAADDGVMPQTREHLGILELLGTELGIIVITKTDLVDEEWLSLITEDVKNFASGSFLAEAPILHASTHTGQGIGELKELIETKIKQAPEKKLDTPFRLPVDRVFTMDGFGTVVTGTLIEGTIKTGDIAQIYPGSEEVRIRGVQVHGKDVDISYAGQRVAINLAGLHKEQIKRGDTLAMPKSLCATQMLDVKLSVLKDSAREVKSGQKLHFHYGTASVVCKAVLMDTLKLTKGGECFAQLRFAEEIAVKRGDPFVLRFYSPTETIGGGVILNEQPKKFRKSRLAETIGLMKELDEGDISSHILQMIDQGGITAIRDVLNRFGVTEQELKNLELIFVGTKNVMTKKHSEKIKNTLISHLKDFHGKFPLLPSIGKEELRSQALPKIKPIDFDILLKIFDDCISTQGDQVKLASFSITYTNEQEGIKNDILGKLRDAGTSPPALEDLLSPFKKRAQAKQVLDGAITAGEVILTEPGIAFHKDIIEDAKKTFANLAANGSVSLADFRDSLGTSRKFALSILEYFDKHKFTKKTGDSRIIYPNMSGKNHLD